ncbi:MAG TPA: class I SAM-dependent methyltransferase [Arsenicitalea sp.]|nr:class I SAM-dependent methyltransferase [Arsenicitalea sp.]
MISDAARFTGSIPEHYDRGLGPMIFVDYATEMARRVVAHAPKRVLETAAGTGIVTRALRDALPSTVGLTATDLNPPMLEIARTKSGSGEPVEFLAADAMALPFADGSFDAVVCQFGVMFFPDKPKSYAEVFRVLEPGGHYLFSVWDEHRFNPFGRIVHDVAARFFPADPPQFYTVPFSSHRIDPVKQALLDVGFAGITISVVTLQKQVPDAAAFARGLVFGNPLRDQILARGGDPEQVVEAVLRELHREFGADPGSMPLQAIMFSAQRPFGR